MHRNVVYSGAEGGGGSSEIEEVKSHNFAHLSAATSQSPQTHRENTQLPSPRDDGAPRCAWATPSPRRAVDNDRFFEDPGKRWRRLVPAVSRGPPAPLNETTGSRANWAELGPTGSGTQNQIARRPNSNTPTLARVLLHARLTPLTHPLCGPGTRHAAGLDVFAVMAPPPARAASAVGVGYPHEGDESNTASEGRRLGSETHIVVSNTHTQNNETVSPSRRVRVLLAQGRCLSLLCRSNLVK